MISASLGTEKLEKQLTEPSLQEADNPLVFEFFRAALISDLQLPASGSALSIALDKLRPSSYLTEAMIWKILGLRRLDRISEEQFNKLAPIIATAIASLKGGTAKNRSDEKRKQLERLRKTGIKLRLQKAIGPK
jgi:hypothetical protein